ncbi:WD40 repeat-like protein [Sistotremastrum suecicum HHB10207 ss-3]|uniref:WD40 repeat-like protein n=1 Tax=Sistotremastrum suecicum HHB10207 ss-3 TaxID=1314776 RepID=A0A166GUC8_9AGAM|nr:WD40 repeat-like protein [Sistotremastrum suecicum HHB10207 ss-3]
MSGSQRFLESDCYSDYNLGKLATLSLSDPVVKPLDDEPTFEMITTTLEQQFYSRPQVQVRRHTVWHDLVAGPKPKHQPSKSMLWGYQAQYKEAPGSIMCIAHQNNLVVIGSATSGGQAEPEGHQRQGNRNTLPDPYNGDGNLMVLCKNRLCKVEGAHHTNQFKTLSKRPQAPIPQDQVKFYSVTGVKFDLQRAGRFVTTGDSEWTPTDLEWHPDHSLCAVATKKSNVYLNAIQTDGSNSIIKNLAKLRTSASNNHESTGKIIFGYSASSGLLFTSTESENNITGCHKAFDVSTCRERWSLQECKGSSDAMSLAPKGDTLAVVTRSNKISASIRVRSFTGSQLFGEISDISFSPDGLILALGRNDDIIDIYDTRFLRHEKVLKRLSHHPDKKTANKELYGITGVRWLQPDSALASCGHYNLVTGGADGMVRLWDVSKSLGTPEDSMVLSSSEYDVASFSLGDTADHPLVVGDCGGAIYDYRYPRGRKAYPKF